MTRTSELDARPLVVRAACASLVLLTVKVGALVEGGRRFHARTEIGHWLGIPFLKFRVGPLAFTTMTSRSTVATGFAGLAIVVVAVLRMKDRMTTAGWLFAWYSVLVSVATDVVLHVVRGPYVDPVRMRWAVGALLVTTAIVGAWLVLGDADRDVASEGASDVASEGADEDPWHGHRNASPSLLQARWPRIGVGAAIASVVLLGVWAWSPGTRSQLPLAARLVSL